MANDLQAYKDALAKANALKAKAVETIKAEIAAKEAELKALNDQLAEFTGETAKPKAKKAKQKRAAADPTKPCSICGIVTSPAHNARMHKQPKTKYTDAELKEKGYTVVK